MRSKADMSKLLKGSLPAVYWMGFLLADGHFTKSGSAIQVSVALQDQDHLTRFANFVGLKLQHVVRIHNLDAARLEFLVEIFQIFQILLNIRQDVYDFVFRHKAALTPAEEEFLKRVRPLGFFFLSFHFALFFGKRRGFLVQRKRFS